MEAPAYFFAVTGATVDRESGVIHGVSVITEGAAKGHGILIDQTTLAQVKECAEQFPDGVRVKVNHGTGFDSIVGVLRSFRIAGPKLIADLHLLRNHEMRDRIFEIASEMPGSVGLSIHFSGENEEIKGARYARCSELYSVDFVDRPAANPSGLFQRVDSPKQGMDSKSLLTKFKEFISGVEAEVSGPTDFEAKATELEKKLAAADGKLVEFSALQKKFSDLEAAKAALDLELKAAKEAVTEFDAKVEKAAADKAAAITAQLGIPPVSGAGDGGQPKLDFSALVGAQVKAGKTKAEAIQFCVKNHAAEYSAWLQSGKTATL